MSVEVQLSLKDYRSIISWFELAFGKNQAKQTQNDLDAFKKITVMCMAKIDEDKEDEKE